MSNDYDKVFSQNADNVETKSEQGGDSLTARVNALGRDWSIDEAAKKIESAESFIETLKREKRELEEKLQSAAKLEDVLESVKQKDTTVTEPTSHVDAEDLVKKTLAALKAEEQNRTAEENFKKSEEAIKAKLGEDYKSKMAEVAKENGLSPDALASLMRQSPTAIQKLIGVDPVKAAQPSQSGINSSAFQKANAQLNDQDAVRQARELYRKKRDFNSLQTIFEHKLNQLRANRS